MFSSRGATQFGGFDAVIQSCTTGTAERSTRRCATETTRPGHMLDRPLGGRTGNYAPRVPRQDAVRQEDQVAEIAGGVLRSAGHRAHRLQKGQPGDAIRASNPET